MENIEEVRDALERLAVDTYEVAGILKATYELHSIGNVSSADRREAIGACLKLGTKAAESCHSQAEALADAALDRQEGKS